MGGDAGEVAALRRENSILRQALAGSGGAYDRTLLLETSRLRFGNSTPLATAPAGKLAHNRGSGAASPESTAAAARAAAAAAAGPSLGSDAHAGIRAGVRADRGDAPLELRMSDLEALGVSDTVSFVFKFARLGPGGTVRSAAAAAVAANGERGIPHLLGRPEHLAWVSSIAHGFFSSPGEADMPFEELAACLCKMWSTNAYVDEWGAHMKNLLLGIYEPAMYRAVRFADPQVAGARTKSIMLVNWSAVLVDNDGTRWWGEVYQGFEMSASLVESWGMCDMMSVKYNPACVTVVARKGGTLLWQNARSMGTFGCHGLFNCITSLNDSDGDWLSGLASAQSVNNEFKLRSHDFMQLLFHVEPDLLEALQTTLTSGATFECRLSITHPLLRACMGLHNDQESYHDLQVSLTKDPVNLQPLYIISQMEVTDHVIAQRALQAANIQLHEQQEQKQALLVRQYDLIACLGMVSDAGASETSSKSQAEMMNAVKQDLIAGDKMQMVAGGDVELLEDLGSGSFGKVYRGLWNGTVVAVKSILLQVVHEQLRPVFPGGTPPGYAQLAEACWSASPESRPSFADALRSLRTLAHPAGSPVPPPLQPTGGTSTAPQLQRSPAQAAAAAGAGAAEARANAARPGPANAAQATQPRPAQAQPRPSPPKPAAARAGAASARAPEPTPPPVQPLAAVRGTKAAAPTPEYPLHPFATWGKSQTAAAACGAAADPAPELALLLPLSAASIETEAPGRLPRRIAQHRSGLGSTGTSRGPGGPGFQFAPLGRGIEGGGGAEGGGVPASSSAMFHSCSFTGPAATPTPEARK